MAEAPPRELKRPAPDSALPSGAEPPKKWKPITGTLVPIVNGKEGLKQEWSIIELQGELVNESGNWDNQVLGELEIRDGNPFLTIGIHELEGRFETLKKPYAVLEPKPDGDEVETVARGVICKSKFIVKGIVKVKAMFKMRPRVLIDKSAAAHAASAASDWAPDSPAGAPAAAPAAAPPAPPATPPAAPPDAPMADAPPRRGRRNN